MEELAKEPPRPQPPIIQLLAEMTVKWLIIPQAAAPSQSNQPVTTIKIKDSRTVSQARLPPNPPNHLLQSTQAALAATINRVHPESRNRQPPEP